jgi:nitric oxide reductase subunit B
MNTEKKLWLTLIGVLLGTFLILGFFGREVYRQAPPIPARVETPDGRLLMTEKDILDGQQVWQSIGGQQVGSIWGHGAYQAPDWSADWLHREATTLLDLWSTRDFEQQRPYAQLAPEQQAALARAAEAGAAHEHFDAATGVVVISAERAAGDRRPWPRTTKASSAAEPTSRSCATTTRIHERDRARRRRRQLLTKFFFWTAWACRHRTPGQAMTYTNNWPHEPLIGNVPSSANILWSI